MRGGTFAACLSHGAPTRERSRSSCAAIAIAGLLLGTVVPVAPLVAETGEVACKMACAGTDNCCCKAEKTRQRRQGEPPEQIHENSSPVDRCPPGCATPSMGGSGTAARVDHGSLRAAPPAQSSHGVATFESPVLHTLGDRVRPRGPPRGGASPGPTSCAPGPATGPRDLARPVPRRAYGRSISQFVHGSKGLFNEKLAPGDAKVTSLLRVPHPRGDS